MNNWLLTSSPNIRKVYTMSEFNQDILSLFAADSEKVAFRGKVTEMTQKYLTGTSGYNRAVSQIAKKKDSFSTAITKLKGSKAYTAANTDGQKSMLDALKTKQKAQLDPMVAKIKDARNKLILGRSVAGGTLLGGGMAAGAVPTYMATKNRNTAE